MISAMLLKAYLLVFAFSSVVAIQYELYKETKTWDDARLACSRDNKRLVHVMKAIEHTRIKNYKPFIFEHFWIGLRAAGKNYQWLDHSVAKFTAWGEGQPSSQSECVRYSAANFRWETHNCSALLFFMCELDVPPPKVSGSETKTTGLMIGFATILGLLLLGLLMLQLPCCRLTTVKAIGHFGLGRR